MSKHYQSSRGRIEIYDIFSPLWKDGNFSRIIDSFPIFLFFSFVVQKVKRRKLKAIVDLFFFAAAKVRKLRETFPQSSLLCICEAKGLRLSFSEATRAREARASVALNVVKKIPSEKFW